MRLARAHTLAGADASYTTAIGFVVVLSVGEVIYSPRVYEVRALPPPPRCRRAAAAHPVAHATAAAQYTMLLAPRGREGLYTSLASAPMFVAKLFAGGLSGELLDRYCPKVRCHAGAREPAGPRP